MLSSSAIQFVTVSSARGRAIPDEISWSWKEAGGKVEESSDRVESYAKAAKAPSANLVPSCTLQRTLRNDEVRFGHWR